MRLLWLPVQLLEIAVLAAAIVAWSPLVFWFSGDERG